MTQGAHPCTATGTPHSCGSTWFDSASCRMNTVFLPEDPFILVAVCVCARGGGGTKICFFAAGCWCLMPVAYEPDTSADHDHI